MDKEILRRTWKEITASDDKPSAGLHAQYCLMKALAAKSNEPAELALGMIYHAFTPITNLTKLQNGQESYAAVRDALTWVAVYGSTSLLYKVLDDSEFERRYLQTLMQVIKTSVHLDKMRSNDKTCVYVYVRNDLTPEQITVLTAHMTYEAGYRLASMSIAQHPSIVVFGITSATDMEKKFAAFPPTRMLGSLIVDGKTQGFILKPMLASVGRRKKYFVDDQLMTMINPQRTILGMVREPAIIVGVIAEATEEETIRDEC